MPKCNFNFIEITLRHGCSPVNLLHIFRTPFPKNTSGRLLLYFKTKLCNRKQRVKINYTYISSRETLYTLQQGSIIGSLLFKVFLCDFPHLLEDTGLRNSCQ